MRRSLVMFGLIAIVVPRLEGADPVLPTIKAADFPSIAARVPFFEKRINAKDARIREDALLDASRASSLRDKNYMRFLKRMMHDSEPDIRGEAIRRLYDGWVPVEIRELPTTFTGYSRNQILNLENENLIPQLIAQCRRGGAEGGWAAYALGLLRCKKALPALVKLGEDSNEFARYTAGRALLNCGARKEARAIFQKLMSHRFKPRTQKYEGPGHSQDGVDPYYVALAARAFMEVGSAERKEGLRRLVTMLGELEPSKDINHGNRLAATRWLLAEVTGQFFVTHREALDWLNRQERLP